MVDNAAVDMSLQISFQDPAFNLFCYKTRSEIGDHSDFYRAPSLVFTGSLGGLDTQQNHKMWSHPFTIANQDPGGGDGTLEDATEEVLPLLSPI